jgi:hypothetical protein
MTASVVSAAAGPPPSSVPSVPQVAQAPDSASAVLAANRQGSRVEALDQRTPYQQTFANPGGTMTTEQSVVPLRVKRGERWLAIDTELVVRPDGLVEPKAAVGEAVLSGGGSVNELMTLYRDGHKLSYRWPGALPTPVVSGNAATYPEVFPGVDLVLRAERNGVAQHLVIKTPAAARNPALAAIRLPITSPGLTVRADADGALHATDAAGTEVFMAPPSTMWDATGQLTKVGVSIVDNTLVLQPDQQFLTNPATGYPVTVDPTTQTAERNAWATMLSGKGGTPYWWTSGAGPSVAQVGQCYTGDGLCNNIGEAWTALQFDTGFLRDKRVHEITFRATTVYSPSCELHDHILHGFPVFGSGLTWDNGWRSLGGPIARFIAPVVRNGCPDGGGWKSIGLPLGASYNPSGLSAYILKAVDGGAQRAWRKYRPEDFKITTVWNRAPNAPSDLRTDPPLPDPCKWCGGKSYIGDQRIRLIGNLSDPDNDAVDPQFEVKRTPGGTETIGWGLGFVPSGQPHSTSIDIGNDHDKTISWKLRTGDGTLDVGPWADAPRAFVVDRKGVTAEPGVSSVLYPEDNAWHGGVGVPGEFTLTPGAPCDATNSKGTCDINHYLYAWDGGPYTKVDANALGGSATVKLAPPGDGRRTLHVQSVDRANHASTLTKHYTFTVRAGNGARSQWSLEGNANDTAFLGDRHGSLSGNATYQPGAVGTGLAFDGSPDSKMTAPNTVRTDASFSVSAWVRLNAHHDAGGVAVEQRGNADAAFALTYHGELRKWIFVLPGADVSGGQQTAWHHVASPDTVALGTWTHLTGTYDAFTRQLTLYVNGNPAGTATRQTPWHGGGAVQVGRQFNGGVDEVQLYDRVLGAAEVKAMVSRDNVQVGHWKFDDKNGTTAENSVDGGESGVLQGGARFIDDGAVGRAIEFNGTDGQVTTSGPAVRTNQSFTVAAWVKARELTGAMTAVGQEGLFASGFYLQYASGPNKWTFLRFTQDVAAKDMPPDGWVGVQAGQAPSTEWTHLAGTFNAADKKMTIYVNGQKGGEAILPSVPWHAPGPLTIGRAKYDGKAADFFKGAVDEVRMYSRVLGPEELEGIVSRNNVAAASWKLDGDALDESVNHRNGTLNGNPAWAAGQSEHPDPKDLAVSLDGVDDYIKAPAIVNTMQGFSVSSWVRLERKDPTKYFAALSQSGTNTQAFTLGYSGSKDRWAFQMNGSNAEPPSRFTQVLSGSVPQVGVWTHLAAVYSATTGQIQLFVNGVASNTGTFAPGFNGQSEFTIGRTTTGTTGSNYFAGAIDDVNVYSRPLFADEVRVMAGRDMSLVHNWRIDEPSGARVADEVGNRPATVSGNPVRDAGRVGNAVRFNGSGAVTTDLVDVPTDKSFTVAAWVNLDQFPPCPIRACRQTAVGVDGGTASNSAKFRLGHRVDNDQAANGKWIFEMPKKDGTIEEAAISVKDGQVNTWVYLVGVYDQPANQLWLYVYSDGDEPDSDSGTLTEPWNATGGLRLGGGMRAGQVADPWKGAIDDVRLYAGDLDVDRLTKLFGSYPASPPSSTTPVPDKGYWKFDENTGAEAKDSSGLGQTATLRNTAGWRAGGRVDHTGWLDGTAGFAETAASVIDTTKSFSISALTYVDKGNGVQTLIAQDRGTVSTFMLQFNPAKSKWSIVVPKADAQNPATEVLEATGQARPGLWAHVAMSYDSVLRQIRLYVNGMLVGVRVGVSILDPTGPMTFGKAKRNGTNVEFLGGAIDDVQVFGSALTEGQVRRIHDNLPSASHGNWSFEGNPNDTSWRRNPTTLTGTSSYGPGVRGQAVQLDGWTGSASTSWLGANMMDSFTVTAWAKLSHTDRDATIVGQDGARMSEFVLQYNKNVGRWIFGAATQDADDAPLVYAYSPQAPAVNTWTHLTGVYDFPARQLRLYVNGELVSTRNDAPLWVVLGSFTIGRGKTNGVASGFFTGALDEVRTDLGALPAEEIAVRASYPAPAGGQLGRFVNAVGEHQTVNATTGTTEAFAPIPAGYRFEGSLGQVLAAGVPNTRKLYTCRSGADTFTSAKATCDGATVVGELGWVYSVAPTDVPFLPLYSCSTGAERFDSPNANCEGVTQVEHLGYSLGYAVLSRYVYSGDWEDSVTVYGTAPGYKWAGVSGLLAKSPIANTQPVWTCRDGVDLFASTDTTCGGKTKVNNLGYLWIEAPAGVASRPYFLCQTITGERVNTHDPACNGHTRLAQLGYLLTP